MSMELKFKDNSIEIEKELNSLDKFVIEFTSMLNNLNIKYVIVSGYVSILFGRNRISEDVDLIIEKLPLDRFNSLWRELKNEFECINTSIPEEAYNDYLLQSHSVRLSKKGNFIPNIELKFPKIELDSWTLDNKKEVLLNNHKLFISPTELQIPFKFLLGTEKDIEDAKYLYEIFKSHLNINLLKEFNRKLNIDALFNKYIKL